MNLRPDTIEKRTFTCTSCGYSGQVYGEQYFDFGTHNYVITFTCIKCKILFEGIISQMECWEMPVVTWNLTDMVTCLWCGTDKNKAWSQETGLCPKCKGKMNYTVAGIIKTNYKESSKTE